MNPLLYALIGLIAGAGIAAIIFAIARRGQTSGSELARRFDLFDRAQERGEKVFRDEFSRMREESSGAAKSQREELTKSLEGVREIVESAVEGIAGR